MIRVFFLLLFALLPAVASAAPAPDGPPARAAAKPKCLGKTATIVGTKRSDARRRKIVGTRKADVIVARGGADDIRGRGGNDLICAGPGNDRVDGGPGKDLIDGSGGKDRLKGGTGDDAIVGGAGNDRLDGGRGKDACDGGAGKDRLRRCEAEPPTNAPPVAVPDAATTTEEATATIPVLANDTDADKDALRLTAVTPAGSKAGVLFTASAVVYSPAGRFDALGAGQTAVETIRYVVTDARGATASGTLTVTVTGVDDAPVAAADAADAEEGTAKTIDVLANDTDVDGGPRKIASVDTLGSTGTVQVTDGGVVYTPGIGVCGGTDTFGYTLEGGSTAKVTVTVKCGGQAPTAVDDAVTVSEDAAATAVDVLANDTDPDGGAKSIVSAGDPAHGTVVVAADGSSLTYAPDADHCGADTFTYTLNRGSTATVSVTVTCVDDAPVAANDTASVAEDAGATPVPVLNNDSDPDAFGKTIAGVTQPAHGVVAITGGGTGLTYKPASNYCGGDAFTYRLDGGSTATVSLTVTCVNDAPVADDESFTGAVGNTPFAVGTTHAEPRKAVAGNVVAGDTDIDSSTLTAGVAPTTTTNGGTVTMESDGEFVYHPPAGFTGTDSFTYTVSDGDKTDTGTVSIAVAGRVWYVDAATGAGGAGTGTKPFNSLAPLNAAASDADAPGDHIFLLGGNLAGPLTMEANQVLRTRSAGLNIGGPIVTASGTNPSLGGIVLATGNAIQGVNLLGTLTGTNFGTATVNTETTGLIRRSGGPAIALDNGTINATLSSVDSTNSTGDGVTLNNVSGALTINGGTLANAGGVDLNITGGAANLAFAGAIDDGTGGLVRIQNTTGGTRTFSRAVTDTADGDNGATGISLVSAAGTTRFAGGMALSTGASDAFSATGAGTVAVTGTTNTIKTTSGAALRVIGTAIHADDLTFQRIDSTGGGADPGILLENPAGTGGLTVTGSGTPGSGGTISSKAAPDGTEGGTGVLLTGARDVSLSRMQLNDFSNFAIHGAGVNGFALIDSVVSGVSGNNSAIDEAAVAFSQLTGSAQVTRSAISGGMEDNLQVRNTSGSLNRLTVSNSTIGLNSQADGNDGIGLVGSGGTFNVSVTDNTFTGSRGDLIQHDAGGTAVSDLVLTGNTMHNVHPNIVGGGGGVTVTSSNTADLTYNVSRNSLRGSKGTAIVVCKCFGGSPADATAVGLIENNTIGLAGSANSGSGEGSGIGVTQLARGRHSAVIRDNQIRRYSNHGILMAVGGAGTSVTLVPHDGTANFTVYGNTIAEPNAPAGGLPQNGIHLNSGTNTDDNYNVCLGLGSPTTNTLTGSGALEGTDYRLRQRFDTDVRMPGYADEPRDPEGDGSLDRALKSYLTSRTSGAFTLSSTATATGGFFNTAGGAACPTT